MGTFATAPSDPLPSFAFFFRNTIEVSIDQMLASPIGIYILDS
jgi:hypothetical protein